MATFSCSVFNANGFLMKVDDVRDLGRFFAWLNSSRHGRTWLYVNVYSRGRFVKRINRKYKYTFRPYSSFRVLS